MALSDLVISEKKLDDALLEDVLRGFIHFIGEDKSILVLPELKERPLKEQILRVLLARKALRAVFPKEKIVEEVAPNDVAEVLGEDPKTISARLSELKSERSIKKTEGGGYILSDSMAVVVASKLKRLTGENEVSVSKSTNKKEHKGEEVTGGGNRLTLPLPDSSGAPKKGLSVGEFLHSKSPTNDVQKALALGYYLEKYRGSGSFNVKDLSGGFREAREPVPTNMNDKVNKNIKSGHFMEAEGEKDGQKAWVLTNSGEVHVEENFGRGNG